MTERLDKVLASLGIGSRKEVRALIKQGRVRIDGEVALDPARRLAAGTARIEVDGRALVPGTMTFMLNKPKGVVTATTDPVHRTVLDLFPAALARRLFPAGRLDKDTEGLLILTSDGDLCHRLISPRYGVEKEYLVHVDGVLSPSLVELFAKGVELKDGTVTLPARLEIEHPGPGGVARVTIVEGKYHQVKRMFGAMGLSVTALKRIRIGGLTLDLALEPGDYRELSRAEVDLLFQRPAGTQMPREDSPHG